MAITIHSDYIEDSKGKKIAIINGGDIYTYPGKVRVGRMIGNDLFNTSGTKVGSSNSKDDIARLVL